VATNPDDQNATPLLSRLVLGTWRVLDDPAGAAPDALAARLALAADLGITSVETAEIYGLYEVERRLDEALARQPGLRQRLRLVSKCGIYVPSSAHPDLKSACYDATAKRIVSSVERSLALLGTDHLDVLLIHRPDWLTPAEETAEGLRLLLEQGKVLHAGVSNYTPSQFETLQTFLSAPLVTNQVELSLFRDEALTDGTLDQCQRLRIHPMAWSPLGGGRLFKAKDEAAERVRTLLTSLGPKYGARLAARGTAALDALGPAGEVPPDVLAYAWILGLPSSPRVVLGTNDPRRIRRAAASAELTLDREDWYALWQAAHGRGLP